MNVVSRIVNVNALKQDFTAHEGHWLIVEKRGWYASTAIVENGELHEYDTIEFDDPDETTLFCIDCGVFINDLR